MAGIENLVKRQHKALKKLYNNNHFNEQSNMHS